MVQDVLQSYTDFSENFDENLERTKRKFEFSKAVDTAMELKDPPNPREKDEFFLYRNQDYVKKSEEENVPDKMLMPKREGEKEILEWKLPKEDFHYRARKEKMDGLDKVLNSEMFKEAESAEVMHLFSAYRELGAYDRMIEVFNKTESQDFKESPVVREAVATALRKDGKFSESLKMSQALRNEGHASAVSYDNIGRCFKEMGSLTLAAKNYEAGFEKTLEPAVGIKAVNANIGLGNKDKAQEMAKVVYLAALRDGAEESKDFYVVSAALQAACIAGVDDKKIEHLCDRLANSLEDKHTSLLSEFKRNMEEIQKAGFKARGFDIVSEKLEQLNGKIDTEETKRSGVIALKKDEKLKDDRAIGDNKKLEALISYSYNYRGCGSDFRGTSRVGGNMEFGGQLPDHTVSKKDLELFKGLVEKNPTELGLNNEELANIKGLNPSQKLSEIKDPEVFMQVVDKFVRKTFQTANFAEQNLHMEENALAKNKEGESYYDATVKAFERGAGKLRESAKDTVKGKSVDTRTNISAIFALGMGDCRHHAQVKQIMFDMYQRIQMDAQIKAMYDQVKQKQSVDLNGPRANAFYDVLDTEVRTTDIQVRMPILMQQQQASRWVKYDQNWVELPLVGANGEDVKKDKGYSPDLDEDGRYKVDVTGRMHNLEDHTLCWIIKKDRDGNLQSFGMRDAFYQEKHYGWGNMDVNIDDIKLNRDGKPLVPAGVIPAEHTDTGKPLQIYQVPTSYNKGRRDTVATHSIGSDICFVGMRMKGFESVDDFLAQVKDRKGMNAIMRKTLDNDPERKTKDKNYARAKEYAPLPKVAPNQKPLSIQDRIAGKQALADQRQKERDQRRAEEKRQKSLPVIIPNQGNVR